MSLSGKLRQSYCTSTSHSTWHFAGQLRSVLCKSPLCGCGTTPCMPWCQSQHYRQREDNRRDTRTNSPDGRPETEVRPNDCHIVATAAVALCRQQFIQHRPIVSKRHGRTRLARYEARQSNFTPSGAWSYLVNNSNGHWLVFALTLRKRANDLCVRVLDHGAVG